MTPMPPRLRKRDGGLPGVITTFSMGRWEPGSALASYLMDVFTTATPARPPKEDTSPLIITGRSALAANEDASKFLQPVRRLENGRGQRLRPIRREDRPSSLWRTGASKM